MDPIIILAFFAVVFSLSIPIVAIVVDYFNKKSKMRVIEKAIEKGLSLEGLSLEDTKKPRPRMPYRAGMIVLAVGLGIGIFAIFKGEIELLGLASIPALIGIALLINDRINYDRYSSEKSESQ
jgi:hypothetical protein